MTGLIGSAEAVSIRAAFDVLLVHTYTRTPNTISDQGYGDEDTPGTPVTSQRCKYRAQTRVRLTNGDRMLVNAPTLTVQAADPISKGDDVSDVADSDGNILLAGPIRVYDVQASAGLGPTLKKTVILQGGDLV
jgi:hypothetical protein